MTGDQDAVADTMWRKVWMVVPGWTHAVVSAFRAAVQAEIAAALSSHGAAPTEDWQARDVAGRALAWLGFWRDKIPDDAVEALQNIVRPHVPEFFDHPNAAPSTPAGPAGDGLILDHNRGGKIGHAEVFAEPAAPPVETPATDVLEMIKRAWQMVDDLCNGRARWVMRVPAQPDSDPDLVIARGLNAADKEIKRLREEVVQGRAREEASMVTRENEERVRAVFRQDGIAVLNRGSLVSPFEESMLIRRILASLARRTSTEGA